MSKESENKGKPGHGKRILLRTFGCQMNVRDSEVTAGLLLSKGYKLAESIVDADVILFNTCSVRQHAEDKVWSEIGKYKVRGPSTSSFDKLRTNPEQSRMGSLRTNKPIIGLIGCMAEYHKYDAFKKAPNIDFVCGPNNLAAIPFLIEQAKHSDTKGMAVGQKQRDEFIYNTDFQFEKDKSFVVISEGCNNYCSYCVVPHVRGMERSRNHEDILEEIENLVNKGIKEITLLGQNVNSYRSDSVDFPKLLEMVNEIRTLKSFSFVTSHPKDASKELFEVMASLDKLKKYLHLPFQSGSDRILRLMNRRYTAREYLEKVGDYRKIVGGALSTDIIVGFPTENDEDFQDTRRVLDEVQFDSAYIFKYSLRPHTEACKLSDDIPLKEKKRRHKILLDLQKQISKGKRK